MLENIFQRVTNVTGLPKELRAEKVAQAAANLAEQQEVILLEALDRKVARRLTLGEIITRVHCVNVRSATTFYLDNVPLITFEMAQVETFVEEGRVFAQSTMRYRVHW